MCDNTEKNKVNDIFELLCRTLSRNREVTDASEKFTALRTNAERVIFADDLLRKYCLYPELVAEKKDYEISVRYRQEGNEAFKKKDIALAWKLYSKSVTHAPINNECLALAHANRSAVLFEKKLYKYCLEDITSAFKNNYPKKLHDKLIQRENKARELLSSEETERYYERVAGLQEGNKLIQCAGPKVEIRKSDALGRHVVAVQRIQMGEVIAVEKPYVQVLLKEHLQDHCYCCFDLSYSMIPCEGCVYVAFCSKKCRDLAWNSYHKYECAILPTLYRLDMNKLHLAALRIAIVARNEYGNIENYNPNVEKMYKSQCYEEIHFLEANTHLRKTANLFPKAVSAAVMRNAIKTGTTLFGDFQNGEKDRKIFDELLMRHLQTGPTNFHEICEAVETDVGFEQTEEIGTGAYAFLSLLNHSCTPNVVRHCHGSEIILRAIKPIKKGAELLDNYGYHYALMKKAERQRELQRQYFFNCICEACDGNWPLYNTLAQRSLIRFELGDVEGLIRGSREVAVTTLTCLLSDPDEYIKEKSGPSKYMADIQETIKQCFALLGNRKVKF